jgi:hypothetical protein
MKIESIIFILAIVIFITFYVLALVYKNKPISDYIITGGIGAILAGTFFGIMKDSIMNQKNNNMLNLFIILLFFIWYILTKIISSAIKDKEVDRPAAIVVPASENTEVIVTEKESSKEKDNWREGLSKSLYNVLITVVISLAVLFAFFSGNRLSYQYKIEILSYTFSYGIVFGIIAPLFLFQSFSIRNSMTITLIFFIWLSITFSITNFLNMKKEYIKRV